VYLVGAGPGDPGLITVRGRDLLARADLVICDVLAPRALRRAARPGAAIVEVGAAHGRRALGQASINRMMIARARRGLNVVRLKGGDPCIFGRGGEEAEALARAGLRFEVVPGVTSALGAAATAGIPLTHRRLSSSVAFATAHVGRGKDASALDWRPLAGAGSAVVYMAVGRLEEITTRLAAAGRSPRTPAALIRWATRPDQEVIVGTLGSLAVQARRAGVGPPAILIVGDVVRLRPRLDWFGRRPLAGRTVVVTRAREQSASLSALLEEEGARVLEAPAIELAPPASWAALDRALAALGRFEILIFTSVNGVARFFERLKERRFDVRDLKGLEVVAIGPATAASLEERGIRVAKVPEEYRAEGVVEILGRRSLRGTGVLIPRAAVARDLLVTELRRLGARVEVTPVYQTRPSREGVEEVKEALRAGAIDLLTFASSSTVTHFLRKFPAAADRALLRKVPAGVIGPITARTARASGFRVAVMPEEYTIPALARAIVERFGRARP
jgi:uroporphyrinogen III methyltransferase/synthase